MVVQSILIILKGLRQDLEFKARLGYTARLYLSNTHVIKKTFIVADA